MDDEPNEARPRRRRGGKARGILAPTRLDKRPRKPKTPSLMDPAMSAPQPMPLAPKPGAKPLPSDSDVALMNPEDQDAAAAPPLKRGGRPRNGGIVSK